ncbi:hypothetical protein RRG08_040433 [Elysia crispata]|uniref:Uncharacterized protein n=1 Tax=Elysia crispata TaxID=231223 RepID=A0AAE0ZDI1_9GAST|nr:hypothetical protein RRG08_040433 [Elysia crispata]
MSIFVIRDREQAKRNIAAIQETRLAASGGLKEKEYTFFCAYASTLRSSPDVKDVFYEELGERIRGIPEKKNQINAPVGADRSSWSNCSESAS